MGQIFLFLEQTAPSWRHIFTLIHASVVGPLVDVVTLCDEMRVGRFFCRFFKAMSGNKVEKKKQALLCTFMLWVNGKGVFSGSRIFLISRCEWIIFTTIAANLVACMQAVLGARKKPEFVMRSPFWIRAARFGSGWGTKRARGGGGGGAGRGEKRKTACPSSTISRRPPVDAVFWLVGRHAVNQHKIQYSYTRNGECECRSSDSKCFRFLGDKRKERCSAVAAVSEIYRKMYCTVI